MRVMLPENQGYPMIIEHEEFLEDEDLTLNLRFGSYELDYGYVEECSCDCKSKIGLPHITVKRDNKVIFSESFNHHWILFLDITKKSKIKHEIKIRIYNMDDSTECETCNNNRYHFEATAIVDSYTYCYCCPRNNEFKKHLPEEPGELDMKIKEELK